MNIMYTLGFVHALRCIKYDGLWHSAEYDLGYAAGRLEYSLESKLK